MPQPVKRSVWVVFTITAATTGPKRPQALKQRPPTRPVQDTSRSWDISEHPSGSGSQVAAALGDLPLCGGTATLTDLTDDVVPFLADFYGSEARRTGPFKLSRVLAHDGVLRESAARNASAGHAKKYLTSRRPGG
ncbi:MAG: hypothetical protein JST91_25605 [Actinobacteria bacterium]|nr:hypothetical protein [Actinomycetota bacterium]